MPTLGAALNLSCHDGRAHSGFVTRLSRRQYNGIRRRFFEKEATMLKIEFTKGSDRDWIVATRDNGSMEKLSFPKKGPTLHDAVHFFVEQALSMHDAFWGKVEQGLNPEEIQALAKSGGHASATRAEKPDDRNHPIAASRTLG